MSPVENYSVNNEECFCERCKCKMQQYDFTNYKINFSMPTLREIDYRGDGLK